MKTIFNGIIFLGVLIILSAAGSSDLGLISIGEIFPKVLLGGFFVFTGYFFPLFMPVIKYIIAKPTRQNVKLLRTAER